MNRICARGIWPSAVIALFSGLIVLCAYASKSTAAPTAEVRTGALVVDGNALPGPYAIGNLDTAVVVNTYLPSIGRTAMLALIWTRHSVPPDTHRVAHPLTPHQLNLSAYDLTLSLSRAGMSESEIKANVATHQRQATALVRKATAAPGGVSVEFVDGSEYLFPIPILGTQGNARPDSSAASLTNELLEVLRRGTMVLVGDDYLIYVPRTRIPVVSRQMSALRRDPVARLRSIQSPSLERDLRSPKPLARRILAEP